MAAKRCREHRGAGRRAARSGRGILDVTAGEDRESLVRSRRAPTRASRDSPPRIARPAAGNDVLAGEPAQRADGPCDPRQGPRPPRPRAMRSSSGGHALLVHGPCDPRRGATPSSSARTAHPTPSRRAPRRRPRHEVLARPMSHPDRPGALCLPGPPMTNRRTRREVLARLGATAALGALVSACRRDPGEALQCRDTSGLSPENLKLRLTLGYVDHSPDSARTCSLCDEFVAAGAMPWGRRWPPPPPEGAPSPPLACGRCKVVPGPVHPRGGCRSFRPKH
jgi:hypothetical protein